MPKQSSNGTAKQSATDPRRAPVNKETWRDWMATEEGLEEGELLSRTHLLNALVIFHGIPMKAPTLVEWEQLGLLPRPIRKHHKGATRALYPGWIIPLVVFIYEQRRHGVLRDDIKAKIDAIREQRGLKQFIHQLTEEENTVDQLHEQAIRHLLKLMDALRQHGELKEDVPYQAQVRITGPDGEVAYQFRFLSEDRAKTPDMSDVDTWTRASL
jgi:hypothetical protein